MLFDAIVSSSRFENIFVAARVLAHHNLRAGFFVSKYAAKAGRCFNSVICSHSNKLTDELSNYERTCTFSYLLSSIIAPVKFVKVSYPNPALRAGFSGMAHREKSQGAFFCSQFVPINKNM